MRMGMQLILPLLSLCMLLHGSSGNNASPSSAKYSALHPIEKVKPNRTYHVKSFTASQPTASLLSNGLVLQSAVVSPTYKGVPVPQTIHGIVPSIPPSTPMAVPHKSAAPPRTMPQIASSIQPSRQIKGPHISRLPPQVMPQLTPSIQPNPLTVVLHISAPPYQIMPRVEPSIPPSPIGVPRNSAPPPQVMTQVEPLRPSPPIGVLSHKLAPLNPTLPKLVPPIPPSPPTIVPQISASPPKIMPQVASYIPPSPPIVLPHNSASPTQIMPRLAPAVQPSFPFVVPSDKLAPLSQTMPKLVPPIPPSPPILVPPSKLGPLPQTIPELAPSSPPSPSIVGPSNKAPPLSQTMPPLAPGVSPSPPIGVPSHNSTPQPQTMPHLPPSIPPTPPFAVPSHKLAPPQQAMPRQVPSTPTPLSTVPSHKLAPPIPRLVPSITPNPPSAVPSHNLAPLLQTMPRLAPSVPPSDFSHKKMPELPLPVTVPNAQVPVAMSPRESPLEPPTMHSIIPGVPPSALSAPPPSSRRNKNGILVPAPPKEIVNHLSPMNRPPKKGTFPVLAPKPHKVTRPSDIVPAPSMSSSEHPGRKWTYSPASSPPVPIYKHHHAWKRASGPSFTPFHSIVPPTYHQGPIILPTPSVAPTAPSHAITSSPKKSREMHHNPVPPYHGPSASPFQSAFPTKPTQSSLAPSPSSTDASTRTKRTFFPPTFSSPKSSPMKPKATLPPPTQALPPPPPNQDCTSLACTEPLTNSPPGSPCACVSPIQVGLRLSVALYTFFPLVSELAEEIASGVYLKQSQVRVMGANSASEQLDKTVVLIDLVPLGERFDNTTAFLTYEKFWYKQVAIKSSFFGDYEVLYVRYPGLPPSPPSAPSSMDTIDGSYSNQGNNARMIHPLGVDVRRKQKKGLGGSIIAIIVLSSFAAVVLFIGAAWFFLIKHGGQTTLAAATPQTFVPSLAKQSGRGVGGSLFGSGLSSASPSFGSSITTYTGSAKTFSAEEVERITNNFDELRVLGEGGFGRVYKGVMEDGTEVAVKVLKRDDQQGGREFFAEVEMLSRLHHRNLVKLIGICVEEHARSLIYELIPNGSVESHLHGVDKEIAPLDWGARIKIALGAARGLAYLHEDSSPHVIHRDFKSSNILLEHDFTPKVSDFGLAKTALEEGHRHISTRVMGTFGYVAPEYAMTGHLLVKSDVYSYGVVLLEILTGRKPVDMSQPQGQENLVAWARPLLTSKVGLEMIIDPALDSNVPFDSVAKVAAIASMCVQPEVSHRPFMGEVVQALKLVCNECDDAKEAESESCGHEDSSVIDIDTRTRTGSCQLAEPSRTHCSDYDTILEGDRELSASYIFSTSGQFGLQPSRSFRRHSSSGPLRLGRSRQFWQTVRGLSRGSVSEHGVAFRLWAGSH